MTRLTHILTLTVALLIAVTSQHMALARGVMAQAAGQAVLCTGQGPKTVTLDRSGVPLGPVQFCPDCALTLMTATAPPALADPVVIHILTLAQTPVRALQNPVIPTARHARGPPLMS